jgi:hypothetical protein
MSHTQQLVERARGSRTNAAGTGFPPPREMQFALDPRMTKVAFGSRLAILQGAFRRDPP